MRIDDFTVDLRKVDNGYILKTHYEDDDGDEIDSTFVAPTFEECMSRLTAKFKMLTDKEESGD